MPEPDGRPWLNLRIKPADVLRLQPGDILVLSIERPLASSEIERLTAAFHRTMAKVGREDVEMIVLAGVDSRLSVIRPLESVEA